VLADLRQRRAQIAAECRALRAQLMDAMRDLQDIERGIAAIKAA
jgi:hypothetical protein